MLSYRHAFHAGNHADVLKHFVLVQLLEYFNQKDKPYWYIDTHAGAGCYSLDEAFARKNAEFEDGVARLLARKDVQFGTWQGHVKLQGIKFILDGSPQARTAYFTRDYARGAPDGSHPWHGQHGLSRTHPATTALCVILHHRRDPERHQRPVAGAGIAGRGCGGQGFGRGAAQA